MHPLPTVLDGGVLVSFRTNITNRYFLPLFSKISKYLSFLVGFGFGLKKKKNLRNLLIAFTPLKLIFTGAIFIVYAENTLKKRNAISF